MASEPLPGCLRVVCVLLLTVVGWGCGGGSSPSAPSGNGGGGTGSGGGGTDNTAQLKSIAGQIAIVTVSGLREARVSPLSNAGRISPLAASSYVVRYECPLGGQVTFGSLPPAIGTDASSVGVVGVTQEWGACSFSHSGVTFTANGSLMLTGSYHAEGAQEIGVAGSLTTSPVGETAVNGTVTGETSFIGIVGGYVGECSACVSVPPTPCSRFDGTYTGDYWGMFAGNEVRGPARLVVANCAITVTQPGSGSGKVTSAGEGKFAGGLQAGATCEFSGRFFEGGVAGGAWACVGFGTNGEGQWRASR